MSRARMIIEPDEDGMWVATCPELPGCLSQGRTRDEAEANLAEAMAAYRECLALRGESLAECGGGGER